MAFLLRAIRTLALSALVLVSSFVVVFAIKNGRLPTMSSSRETIAKVIPASDDSCRFPLSYRIGTIDPKFHLSEEELLSAIREAATIWEKGLGKKLFVEQAGTGSIPFNLVFDDRQAQTDSEKKASSDIESGRSSYDSLRAEYESDRKAFDSAKAAYDARVSKYEKSLREYEQSVSKYQNRLRSYEREVSDWNARGGAPSNEYSKLEDEQKSLNETASDIGDERNRLNDEKSAIDRDFRNLSSLSGQVNTAAGSLNRVASSLNIKVDTYNQVFGSRDEFTTGLYTKDAAGARIDVFQFYDHDDLVLILAHEMGHALGLGHATESESIMYPSVGKQKPTLTDEDRKLFESVCPNQ